jgi:hypothetical protein
MLLEVMRVDETIRERDRRGEPSEPWGSLLSKV